MTTVVNNPGNGDDSSAATLLIVVVILVVVGALFFVYVLPSMRNPAAPQNDTIDINVKLPADNNAPAQY